jgi:hypothetical protein
VFVSAASQRCSATAAVALWWNTSLSVGSRSGTQSDPCISSVTLSIMITTSNSPVKGSGIPNQFLGALLHTIACSGLSRVRTELFQLLVIPSLAPHPVHANRRREGCWLAAPTWHRPSVAFVCFTFLPRYHVSWRFTLSGDDDVAGIAIVKPNCSSVHGGREHVPLVVRVPHLVAARIALIHAPGSA